MVWEEMGFADDVVVEVILVNEELAVVVVDIPLVDKELDDVVVVVEMLVVDKDKIFAFPMA